MAQIQCYRCSTNDPVGGVKPTRPRPLTSSGQPQPDEDWCDVCRNMLTAVDNVVSHMSVDCAVLTNILRKDIAAGSEHRLTLCLIGAQHPAWSSDPDDKLVRIFNEVTDLARTAIGAVGADDDAKADWCGAEAAKLRRAM